MILDSNGDPIHPEDGDVEIPKFGGGHSELELMGFKVVKKRWSQIKAIMAETGLDTDLLLRALKDGHGIEFDAFRQDPFLYFTVSQYQTEGLKRAGIESPTWIQLCGSSEVWALSAEQAAAKYRALNE